MSQAQINLALSLASLLLAGNLAGFHTLAQEGSPREIGHAIDLYSILKG